jgi:hypothetical protein
MTAPELPRLGALVRAHHPGLTDTNHTVTSPKDPGYNCISHGIGDTSTRWQPGGFAGTAWPAEIDQSDALMAWQQFYQLHGFEPCDSRAFEPGFVKVAIYALEGEGTHVARLLHNGHWTSKLGEIQDIEHDLESLEDARYGSVALVMRRSTEGWTAA